MNAEVFAADWSRLRRALADGSLPSPKSEMWRRLIADFPAPEDADADDFARNSMRGYGFSTPGREALPLERAALLASFAAEKLFKRCATAFGRINTELMPTESLAGYPQFRVFLRREGLETDYLATCKRLGVSPDSLSTAKPFWIRSIVKTLGLPQDARILEIGAGAGNLAVLLRDLLPRCSYTVVDLPEMILCSSRAVRKRLPSAPMRIALSADEAHLVPEGFRFVPHALHEGVASASYDLCLNVDSFQEMALEHVAAYLALFQRAAAPRARLLTLNRRKTVGGEDNNPLLYPYGPNRVLRWEADRFMRYVLGAERTDPWLLRLEEKNL